MEKFGEHISFIGLVIEMVILQILFLCQFLEVLDEQECSYKIRIRPNSRNSSYNIQVIIMPLLVQRTYSASNKELVETEPADIQAKKADATKRSLSFSAHVQVQEIPHRLELSLEEIEATWYDQQECKAIKLDAVQVIKRMMANTLQKDECVRGLEHRAPEAAKQRKLNKRLGFQTVWDIQEEQWEDGVTDHEVIAIKYQMQTFKSREAALELGIQDEKDCRKLSSRKSFLSKLKR